MGSSKSVHYSHVVKEAKKKLLDKEWNRKLRIIGTGHVAAASRQCGGEDRWGRGPLQAFRRSRGDGRSIPPPAAAGSSEI